MSDGTRPTGAWTRCACSDALVGPAPTTKGPRSGTLAGPPTGAPPSARLEGPQEEPPAVDHGQRVMGARPEPDGTRRPGDGQTPRFWPTTDADLRLGRALGASTAGAVAGALGGGTLGAWIADGVQVAGWSALGLLLAAAVVGVALGSGAAQWIAFADESRWSRGTSVLVTSLGTLLGFPSAWALLGPLAVDWLPPQVVLVTVLLAATALGRVAARW